MKRLIYISKFNNRFANFNSDVNADGDYIICTNYKDNDLANFSRRLEANVNSVSIISDNRKTIIDNEYYLNGDYSIERI